MATDPGWVPAIGNFWRYLLFPTWQQRSRRVNEMPVLVWIRTMTLSAPGTWLILLIAIEVIRKPSPSPRNGRLFATLVAGVGVLAFGAVVALRARPLAGGDAPSVASAYRSRFFLGWSFATTPVVFGFFAYFEAPALTVYLVGLVFGALCIAVNAPTRMRLRGDEARLRSPVADGGLLDALMLQNGSIPQRPRR